MARMMVLVGLMFFCLLWQSHFASASLVPNLHWTFDVDENKNTYEMRSVTQNVGNMLSGTTALPSNERYGSVAHFNGKDSGIIIDNVTSSCFIDPGVCIQGLSFSFWINWQKWGTNPILASPSIAMKHMAEGTLIAEIWDGQKSWNTFISRSSPYNGVWDNYIFTWDKISLTIFVNGVFLLQINTTRSSRHSLLSASSPSLPRRLEIGKSSSSSGSSAPNIQMYLDDFQIWEKPLNTGEVLQVYQSGRYDPSLFEVEDISLQLQVSYISEADLTEKLSDVIRSQVVSRLTDCFIACFKISSCKVVGYQENGSQNVCQLRNGISFDEKQKIENERFHYYWVDRS